MGSENTSEHLELKVK